MAAQTLNIELPPAERPSVWPWLVALLSGAALIVVVSEKTRTIPQTLQQRAQAVVSAEGFDTIDVVASGRDMNLQGTIEIGQSTAQMVEKLAALEGVRLVRDQLVAIDPEATALQARERFLQALSGIDLSAVAFEPGSVQFTSGSDTALQELAALMQQNPDYRVRIEGHTDNTGRESVNLRLSRERADAVARYLAANKVAPEQLIAKGYGSTQPIADNDTDNGRSRNRRIEISYVD